MSFFSFIVLFLPFSSFQTLVLSVYRFRIFYSISLKNNFFLFCERSELGLEENITEMDEMGYVIKLRHIGILKK